MSDYEDIYSCQVEAYAMETLPSNLAILKSRIGEDERVESAIIHALSSYCKLSELSLVVQECVDTGWDKDAFWEAYNKFRKEEWDD